MFLNKVIALYQCKVDIIISPKKPKFIKIEDKEATHIIDLLLTNIKKYCTDLENLSNDQLLGMLSHKTRLRNRICPKLDVRRALNGDIIGFSVSVPKESRNLMLADLRKELKIFMEAPGDTTIEFGLDGVNKGLAIRYLNKNLTKILDTIQYKAQPHWLIDARKYNTVIVSDADSTLYGKPLANIPNGLTINNLSNSKAKESILNYLEMGGVLVVCTGADIESTVERLLAGIPKDKMKLINRIVLMSNSGATLNYFNSEGKLVEYKPYREEALGIEPATGKCELDAIYMGDDHRKTGNDYPAFREIGFDRSIVVSPSNKKNVSPELQSTLMGSVEVGTGIFLAEVLTEAKRTKGETPLFSPQQIQSYIKKGQ